MSQIGDMIILWAKYMLCIVALWGAALIIYTITGVPDAYGVMVILILSSVIGISFILSVGLMAIIIDGLITLHRVWWDRNK